MNTMKILLLITMALLPIVSSCRTVKQTEKSQIDQQITEHTVTELVKSEVERTLTSLSQTVIEFYPESAVCGSDTLLAPALSVAKQPIKRIIRTDMGRKEEKRTQVEAVQRKDSVARLHATSETQIVDKPPASPLPETLLFIVCGVLLLCYLLYYLLFNRR